MRSVSSPRAVSMMIGTWAVAALRRRRRQTSIPVTPSIIQSRMTRSGVRSSASKQRLLAVGGADDLIAFALEMPDQQVGERAVVFDEQEPGLGHAAPA